MIFAINQPTKIYMFRADCPESMEKFWTFKCPCDVEVVLPINGLPTTTTPYPCGNKDHWLVYIDSENQT